MEESKAGIQLNIRQLILTAGILLALIIFSGILTQVIPSGAYDRIQENGRMIIDPSSFHATDKPNYPIWRWLTAPIEVLIIGPDQLLITVILTFILMMGISFAILDKCGILLNTITRLVNKFVHKKYILLAITCLCFMLLGSLFGIIEEALALIPLMITLSLMLGWDSLMGLGISFLALNTGFSVAILNPFTLGVVQNIADLPIGSGVWFRVIVFLIFYAILFNFLLRYAKKIEKNPLLSPIYSEEKSLRGKFSSADLTVIPEYSTKQKRATIFLLIFMGIMVLILVCAPLLGEFRDFVLPLAGLVFLIAGFGTGFISGMKGKEVWKAALDGFLGMLPAVPLILLAVSPNYIAVSGGIMDSIIHWASQSATGLSAFGGAVLFYLIVLVAEFFMGAASAKALLLMPILLPLGDIIGLTRQTSALAYCFGDGFANALYPTGILLVVLNLTVIGYVKWFRWTIKLWIIFIAISVISLGVAVAVNYGPF